jgi:two-component system response regulator FixJ
MLVGKIAYDNMTDEDVRRDAFGTFRHADLAHRHIHILDTDLGVCEALSVVFRLEGYRTSFSTTSGQFITTLDRQRPDVVVVNLELDGESGLNIIRRIRTSQKGAIVVMLANAPSVDAVVAAMKLGAIDVLSKPIDSEHLLRIVREALLSNVRLSPGEGGQRRVEVRGFSQLTPREREVLNIICNGCSNKEAGRMLGISPRTVEVHRAKVMSKLGARNTADLMKIVLTSWHRSKIWRLGPANIIRDRIASCFLSFEHVEAQASKRALYLSHKLGIMNKRDNEDVEDEACGAQRPFKMAGVVSAADLSDEQLLYYYDRLHNPLVIADRWIDELQAEVLRRGLRAPS